MLQYRKYVGYFFPFWIFEAFISEMILAMVEDSQDKELNFLLQVPIS